LPYKYINRCFIVTFFELIAVFYPLRLLFNPVFKKRRSTQIGMWLARDCSTRALMLIGLARVDIQWIHSTSAVVAEVGSFWALI